MHAGLGQRVRTEVIGTVMATACVRYVCVCARCVGACTDVVVMVMTVVVVDATACVRRAQCARHVGACTCGMQLGAAGPCSTPASVLVGTARASATAGPAAAGAAQHGDPRNNRDDRRAEHRQGCDPRRHQQLGQPCPALDVDRVRCAAIRSDPFHAAVAAALAAARRRLLGLVGGTVGVDGDREPLPITDQHPTHGHPGLPLLAECVAEVLLKDRIGPPEVPPESNVPPCSVALPAATVVRRACVLVLQALVRLGDADEPLLGQGAVSKEPIIDYKGVSPRLSICQ